MSPSGNWGKVAHVASFPFSSRAGLWDLGRHGVRGLTWGNPGGAAWGLGGAAAGALAAGASGPARALRPRTPPRPAAPGARWRRAPPSAPAPAPSLGGCGGGGGPGSSAPPRGGKVGTWRRGTPPGAAGRLLGKVNPGGAGRGEAGAGRTPFAPAKSARTSTSKPGRIRRSLASSARVKPGDSLPAHLALRFVSPLTCGFPRFWGDFEWFVGSVLFLLRPLTRPFLQLFLPPALRTCRLSPFSTPSLLPAPYV